MIPLSRRAEMSAGKNVTLTIINYSDAEVKVSKVEYQDGSDWRPEHCLGFDGIQKIEPHGQSIIFPSRDLEHVGGQETEFQVTYREHAGGTSWGDEMYAWSPRFTPGDGRDDRSSATVSIR
jgi:hypothetical protein